MNVYTEKECIASLFQKGGTLALSGLEILEHRKNSKIVYFTYNQKTYCLNKHNVILKFTDIPKGRFFQFACLDFEDAEYKAIVDGIRSKIGR